MSSQKSELFIIGTGFIGQAVLDELLALKQYNITSLTRRPEDHGKALESLGVKTVKGTLDDFDIIASQVEKSHVVIHSATADHLPSAKAVLEGIRRKVKAGKDGGIFIHTSGASVLDDGSMGNWKSDKIYADDSPDEIDALDPKAPHREIDLAIVKALREEFHDKAKVAIMIPPLIYGYNARHGRLSIQVPTLTFFALKHGFAGRVGEGLATSAQIHVNDLARAYIVLLEYLETLPSVEVEKLLKRNPYFYCENGAEFTWKEVAENIGKELKAKGKLDSAETKEIPESLFGDVFGPATGPVAAVNARCKAVRLRQLGWESKEKSLWESYREDELPVILEKSKGGNFAGYQGTVA